MQRIYDDLGMSIEPGCGPDTTDDLVSFALTGTDERVSIVNSLRYQPDGIQTCATTLGIKPSGKPDFTVITLPQQGVSKTLEVTVDSDVSLAYSQRVAKQIINSPLVKTATHGAIGMGPYCRRHGQAAIRPCRPHARARAGRDRLAIAHGLSTRASHHTRSPSSKSRLASRQSD